MTNSLFHLQRAKKILRKQNQRVENVTKYKYIVVDRNNINDICFIRDDEELIKLCETGFE